MKEKDKISKVKNTTDRKYSQKRRKFKEVEKKKLIKRKPRFDFKVHKNNITVIIIVLALVVIYNIFENYHRYGFTLERNINSEQTIQIETANSNNIIKEYKNNILVYNSGKLMAYNRFGSKTWEIKLDEIFSANINTAGKYIQILNKDSGYIYIYSNKYEIARIKINGKIHSGKINDDGTSIIEYDSIGAKSILGVYNKRGNLLYEIKLNNNIIGGYTLSKNSRYLAYVDVNITGISLNSSINIVDLNKVKEKDYRVKTVSTNNNSLVYKLLWNNLNLIIQLDDEVIKYNVLNNKLNEYELGDKSLLNISVYNSSYAYVESTHNNTGYILNIAKLGKEKVKEVSILDSPKHFIYDHGLIYICYQKEIIIYNKLGIKVKNYESDTVISKPVIFNNGKSVAIPISNKIILFTI